MKEHNFLLIICNSETLTCGMLTSADPSGTWRGASSEVYYALFPSCDSKWAPP